SKVFIGHDHYVAGGVRIGVQAHKAVHAAVHDVDGLFRSLAWHAVSDRVVDRRDHIAKHTVFVIGAGRRPGIERRRHPGTRLRVRSGDVAVAPGGPEPVHWPSIAGESRMAGVYTWKTHFFRFPRFARQSIAAI